MAPSAHWLLLLITFVLCIDLAAAASLRGLYVSLLKTGSNYPVPFRAILANTTEQDLLLKFMKDQGFNSISIYDLYWIMQDKGTVASLSNFIARARGQGINEINAIGALHSDFDSIRSYQAAYPATPFSGLVTEIEFWSAADVTTAFDDYVSTLYYMRSSWKGMAPVKIITYLGWLNGDAKRSAQQQAQIIATSVDRVNLHCYVKDPVNAFGYCESRMNLFVNTKISIELVPIFSAEGSKFHAGGEVFMGDWLAKPGNTLDTAEAIFTTAILQTRAKFELRFPGYQWYEYMYLSLYGESFRDQSLSLSPSVRSSSLTFTSVPPFTLNLLASTSATNVDVEESFSINTIAHSAVSVSQYQVPLAVNLLFIAFIYYL